MRRKVIAGNWKMNMTPSQAVKLVTELKPNVNNPDVDVVFCVPSIDIVPVVEAVKGSNIHIGAENVYYQEKGAFTGELSPEMLVDAGVSHVIIGHSERRMYFNESNTVLNLKLHKALEHDIIPILCCGETLEQREKGITLDFVKEQIVEAYVGVTKDQVLHTIVAYEPIWAIGTGKVATTSQAQEVCGFIRTVFEELYDKETADQIRILYGAGGMGGKIMPSAVLVIQNGTTKLVNIKNQDGVTKILDMVPDFVNKFTSRNQVTSDTASAADEDETKAREAAGKEMEDILKDSVNKEEN